MESAIQNWLERIDLITEDVQRNFGSLSDEQLNWKPNPDTWSIGQHIDHLIVINSTYFPVIESAEKGELKLTWSSKLGFMVRFFGRAILKGVKPENKRKTKTFPIWEPATSDIDNNILGRFAAHQEEVKQMFRSSKSLLENGTVIPSPANASINYKLEDAFEIIVTHEKRHVNHALSLLQSLFNQNS